MVADGLGGPASRRAFLAAAVAGVATVACGHPHAAILTSRASSSGPPFPIFVPSMTAAQEASFAALAPGLAPIAMPAGGGPTATSTFSSDARATGAAWQITAAVPFGLPPARTFAPVEPALRQVNFNASTLVPGAMDAFAGRDGTHYAVPGYAGPWAVQYDPAVLAQLGLAEPADDWSIDDFEDTCAAITGAIAAGRLPNLQAALAPLVGSYVWPPNNPAKLTAFGAFNDADLWGAFILGFGGTLVTKQNTFDLGDPGAVAGLQRMADIATRHALPPSAALVPRAYALGFAATAGLSPQGTATPSTSGTQRRFARFPRLPVTPVIPVKTGGFTVLPTGDGMDGLNLGGGAPATAPVQALAALVDYALWWYGQYRQSPGEAGLPPPVLADATVQQAYWTAPGRPAGYPAVGDWRHFSVVETGWPLVPDQVPAEVEFAGQKPSPVYAALTQAVQDRVPVSSLVQQINTQLNALLPAANASGT